MQRPGLFPSELAGLSSSQSARPDPIESRNEGIIPALESFHAMHLARKNPETPRTVLVNLSGRGDKDMDYMIERYGTGDDFAV